MTCLAAAVAASIRFFYFCYFKWANGCVLRVRIFLLIINQQYNKILNTHTNSSSIKHIYFFRKS